jgi:hypothetical protein
MAVEVEVEDPRLELVLVLELGLEPVLVLPELVLVLVLELIQPLMRLPPGSGRRACAAPPLPLPQSCPSCARGRMRRKSSRLPR